MHISEIKCNFAGKNKETLNQGRINNVSKLHNMIRRVLYICLFFLTVIAVHANDTKSSFTIEVSYDTICWQPIYFFKGGRFDLPKINTHPVDSFLNIILEYRDKCACKKYKLKLAIAPSEYVQYDTITSGDYLIFYGDTLTETGVYSKPIQTLSNCTGNHTLYLTVQKPVTIEDTLVICDHELPYTWHGTDLEQTGIYVYTEPFVGTNVDSLTHILHLNVLSTIRTSQDINILQGDTCIWYGKYYTETGVYADTLQGANGCDSISILNLIVRPNIVSVKIHDIPVYCADDSIIEISMTIRSGEIDALLISPDSLAKTAGLKDTTIIMPKSGEIILPNNGVRAGTYNVVLTGLYHSTKVFSEKIKLTFLYPSTVMEQKWNDVIIMLTNDYNGGYDFVAFQWYKNGSVLPDETNHYLSQPLEVGAEYSVLLTESGGNQMMSCPIIARKHSDISLYPTIVDKKRVMQCKVAEPADIYVYTITGEPINVIKVAAGVSSIEVPYATGIYIVKIITQSAERRDMKILLL